MKKEALLSVRDLSVAFQTRIAGGIKKVLAVKNIYLALAGPTILVKSLMPLNP